VSIAVTPFEALGKARHGGWLDATHHFSFAGYRDPNRMGFGPLRVWNDDTIAPGGGFPFHPHRDMEIVTYVRQGAITHQDSLGNKGRTVAGDVQVMSAGTGIVHSEFNHEAEATQLFQIWIEPNRRGHAPRWDTRAFPRDTPGELVLMVSGRPGENDALRIHQNAALYGAALTAGDEVEHWLMPGRRAYVVPVGGTVEINGVAVPPRAGAAIVDEDVMTIRAVDATDLVLADLP